MFIIKVLAVCCIQSTPSKYFLDLSHIFYFSCYEKLTKVNYPPPKVNERLFFWEHIGEIVSLPMSFMREGYLFLLYFIGNFMN